MVEVRQGSSFSEEVKQKISEVFVEGFGHHFTYFSKDSIKLMKAFEHMFLLDYFYVGIVDGEVAGIVSCTNGQGSSVSIDKKELVKYLGFFKGRLATFVLKQEFEKQPIKNPGKKAYIEFVATSSKFRGKGVASTIISYLFSMPQYDQYILEVVDTNEPAIKLYEKLGFKEFQRVKHPFSNKSGINFLVHMKYEKLLVK